MVAADAGEDFGRQTSALLGKLLSRRGILLAAASAAVRKKFGLVPKPLDVASMLTFCCLCLLEVCTSDYAEKTSSKYSSHEELRTAYDNDLDIIPLRVEDTYPPRPPAGKKHPYDPDEEALGLIAMALPRGRVFIDCRSLTLSCTFSRPSPRLFFGACLGAPCAPRALVAASPRSPEEIAERIAKRLRKARSGSRLPASRAWGSRTGLGFGSPNSFFYVAA